jgi:hypothetical protein
MRILCVKLAGNLAEIRQHYVDVLAGVRPENTEEFLNEKLRQTACLAKKYITCLNIAIEILHLLTTGIVQRKPTGVLCWIN